MTQSQADRATDAEERKVVFGIDESALDLVEGGLTVDTGELSDGGLADIMCTIIGIEKQDGGEVQTRDDGTEYTTRDQIIFHERIDNAGDLDIEFDTTRQFFSLPKLITRDGQSRRAKPTRSSGYGIWLSILEGLGVSANPEMAHVVQINSLGDFVGLQMHRVQQDFESFNGQSFRVAVPSEIFGYDNEIRKQNGLPEKYLKGQEPVAAGRKG